MKYSIFFSFVLAIYPLLVISQGPPKYLRGIIEKNIMRKNDALTNSQRSNQEHITQLLTPFHETMTNQLKKLNFNFEAYWGGVLDSDLGKFSRYQDLFFKKSQDSDHLLNNLKGVGAKETSQALAEFLSKHGHPHKFLLNPKISNENIRKIFKKYPILAHFLHSLPGMLENFNSFEKKIISKETFQKRIGTNLFHNGPIGPQLKEVDQKIFWKIFTARFLPNALFHTEAPSKQVKNFFKHTVYEGRIKKNIVYPTYHSVTTFEGYVHCFIDRLGQGTRVGIIKIFNELYERSRENRIHQMYDLLYDNPRKTKRQLELLIISSQKDKFLTKDQKKFLKILITIGVKRMEQLIHYVKKSMSITKGSYDRANSLSIHYNNHHIIFLMKKKKTLIIENKKINTYQGFNEAFCENLKKHILFFLKWEEKINGNPIEKIKWPKQ